MLRKAYKEVLGVNVTMLGKVVVLLGHEHSLTEDVLVDLLAVGLGDKPGQKISNCGGPAKSWLLMME